MRKIGARNDEGNDGRMSYSSEMKNKAEDICGCMGGKEEEGL